MSIIAGVENGTLVYDYTDSSASKTPSSTLGYDQFLQLLCAEMQYQDPLEPTSNTDYIAQLATFSELEATLSMQNTQQSTMASNLVGKQVILKVVSETTGATTYVDGKVDYVMYQNGEIFLSVNDSLYPISSLDTVADSDYYEAISTAQTINSMMSTFPDLDNISAAYENAAKEVRDLYESLTDYQKSFVSSSDIELLEAIEKRIQELLGAEEAAGEDVLPEEVVDEVSEEDLAKIL